MATLHKLLPLPRLSDGLTLGHSAEIIIFPGVRYERLAAPATPAKSTRKSPRKRRTRVKRDHLVISAK
jgi:hypothetical protein